jgi:hypothetical protein
MAGSNRPHQKISPYPKRPLIVRTEEDRSAVASQINLHRTYSKMRNNSSILKSKTPTTILKLMKKTKVKRILRPGTISKTATKRISRAISQDSHPDLLFP